MPSALLNLVRRKSVFSSNDPVYAMLDHIFRPEYAHQPYSEFPSNVVVHLGRKGSPPILRVSNGELCDEECKSLRDKRRSDCADHWFDPVYAGQYGKILRDTYSTGAPTLVSTPWKSGQKGNVRFANCFPSKRQKLDMLNDFARLVLNLPNHGWGHDIYAAFES